MDPISAALIGKSLDGLTQRQMYLAQNLANANTLGYRAFSVEFEDALRNAAPQGLSAIEAVQPSVHTLPQAEGEDMRIDLQMAEFYQTAMRYRALTDVLSRQMGLARAVVSGGGR